MLQGVINDWLIADPELEKIDRVSQMYFWWSVICVAVTLLAGAIYLIEYLCEHYKQDPGKTHCIFFLFLPCIYPEILLEQRCILVPAKAATKQTY